VIICVHCHKPISASAGKSLFDSERIFPGPKVHAKTCYPMAQAALHLAYLKLFDKSEAEPVKRSAYYGSRANAIAERSERKSFSVT